MSKVLKLLKNEIIKASRKPFYIVIIALSVVAVIAGAGIMKLAMSIFNGSSYYYDGNSMEDVDYVISDADERLGKIKDGTYYNYEDGYMPSTYEIVNEAVELVKRKARAEVLKEYGLEDLANASLFYSFSSDYDSTKNAYLKQAVMRIADIKAIDYLQSFYNEYVAKGGEPWEGFSASDFIAESYDYEAEYTEILKTKDFAKYIDLQNKIIDEDTSLSDNAKAIAKENNNVLKEAFTNDITDEAWCDISQKISLLTQNKTLVAEGVNTNGYKLSESEIEKAKQTIAEIELGLKNHAMGYGGNQTENQSLIGNYSISFGVQIASIFAVIMGALLIAEEIQSGSIKALIVAPCSRRKIFTAKLLVLLVAVLLETVLIYLSFLIANLIYGLGASSIVFTFLGKTSIMNYYLYNLLVIIIDMAEVFIYGVFALLLSTVLRNTGAAMSISLVITQVVNGIIQTICAFFSGQVATMIVSFIPAVNLGVAQKIFVSQASYSDILGGIDLASAMGQVYSGTWQFSLIYNVIFTALMIFTAYQSFEKRDIK